MSFAIINGERPLKHIFRILGKHITTFLHNSEDIGCLLYMKLIEKSYVYSLRITHDVPVLYWLSSMCEYDSRLLNLKTFINLKVLHLDNYNGTLDFCKDIHTLDKLIMPQFTGRITNTKYFLDKIAHMTNLKELHLDSFHTGSFIPLQQLTKLEVLHMDSYCEPLPIWYMETASSLREIHMNSYNESIESLAHIGDTLEYLSMNKFTGSIIPLRNKKSLKMLYMNSYTGNKEEIKNPLSLLNTIHFQEISMLSYVYSRDECIKSDKASFSNDGWIKI